MLNLTKNQSYFDISNQSKIHSGSKIWGSRFRDDSRLERMDGKERLFSERIEKEYLVKLRNTMD